MFFAATPCGRRIGCYRPLIKARMLAVLPQSSRLGDEVLRGLFVVESAAISEELPTFSFVKLITYAKQRLQLG